MIKILKEIQPLLIAALGVWLYLQHTNNDNFIEKRDLEYKRYTDSLSNVNLLLERRIEVNEAVIDSFALVNTAIDKEVESIDGTTKKKKRRHEKDKDRIIALDDDSTIQLLSRNLSEKDSI